MYSNDSDADKKFEAFGYVDLEKFRLVLEENNYSVYLIVGLEWLIILI